MSIAERVGMKRSHCEARERPASAARSCADSCTRQRPPQAADSPPPQRTARSSVRCARVRDAAGRIAPGARRGRGRPLETVFRHADAAPRARGAPSGGARHARGARAESRDGVRARRRDAPAPGRRGSATGYRQQTCWGKKQRKDPYAKHRRHKKTQKAESTNSQTAPERESKWPPARRWPRRVPLAARAPPATQQRASVRSR